MVRIASILFYAAAVSAFPSISRRDVAETLTNLQAIDASTKSLTTTVQSWDGGLTGALAINTAATDLDNQIKSANTAAQDEGVYSSADSQTVITYITGTLEPDIAASLNALVAKKSGFDSLGLTAVVQSQLSTLRTDTSAYSASLVKTASSDQTANAQAAAAKIDSDFAAAIAAYS